MKHDLASGVGVSVVMLWFTRGVECLNVEGFAVYLWGVSLLLVFRNGPGSMSSGNVGQGGSQGKDPLAPALPGSRNAGMYQHPAVGYSTQDSRSQAMPSVRTK